VRGSTASRTRDIVVVGLPLIVVFVVGQRRIVSGLTSGAIT
jgi:ABC-type maltose transport system permease subunit